MPPGSGIMHRARQRAAEMQETRSIFTRFRKINERDTCQQKRTGQVVSGAVTASTAIKAPIAALSIALSIALWVSGAAGRAPPRAVTSIRPAPPAVHGIVISRGSSLLA